MGCAAMATSLSLVPAATTPGPDYDISQVSPISTPFDSSVINLVIAIMSAAIESERALGTAIDLFDITRVVQQLKNERDLWKMRAEAYKSTVDSQAEQLQEAIDICIATQAELENERTTNRHRHRNDETESSQKSETYSVKDTEHSNSSNTLGGDGSLDMEKSCVEWQSTPTSSASFGNVEQLLNQRHFSMARHEIDRLLPHHLTTEARVEGLLLKSAICRASGPDWLLEGLAQCSEALALCDKLESLHFLLPKIQYHRGLCHFMLHELTQARGAFAAIEPTSPLHSRARKYRRSCDDELEPTGVAKRRSAFEEHRNFTEGFLACLKENERVVNQPPS